MTHEVTQSETKSEPYAIDVESIIEDPTRMLDFLGEKWETGALGLSQREFSHQYEKKQSQLRFVFIRGRDTRAIRLVASMTNSRGRGHSSVSLPNVTFIGVYPGEGGFKGMISVFSQDETRVNIQTKPLSRKISMTTTSGERTDIEL